MTALLGIVRSIERAVAALGAALLFAVMLIVAADVFMRYLLNQPFSWSYDFISLYLMPGLFYFLLARTFSLDGHIAVDIVQSRLSASLRHVCQALTGLLVAGLFGAIALQCGTRAWSDFQADAVTAGAIAWPVWCTNGLAAAGAWLLVASSMAHGAAHVLTLTGGRELIALPHRAGEAERGFE